MATKGAKPAKVGGNSNAGNKPVSSPPTAVVNGESNGESSNVEIVKLAGGKPDQSHHNQAMDELKKNIDKTQAEVNDLRSQLSEGGPSASSPAGQRRQALRTELEELRGKQAGSKGARGKVLDDLRALQDSIAKKVKDLQAAKSKTTFKSVAEVDAQIARLEAQVEAGSMKLAEEKRALTEISTLRRSKRNVEGLATQQAAIDADRAKADELRAGLDDPESKAVSKRYDEIKNELETLQKEHEKTAGSRSKLVEQRVAASAKLDALYATKRERQSTFRSEMDRYFTKVNAEKEKRNERFKEEKKKEELEKKKAHEQQLREEAALPAFSKEIEDCDVLINYFSGASSSSTTSTTKPSTVSEKQSLGKKLELRTVGNDENVPEGAKVAKKKGGEDEEDAFFVGSSKKSSKKNKGKSKGTPLALGESPSDEQPSGSANGSSGGPALHVPLGTLSALLALSIPPPTSQSDTTRVVENLRLKREYFVSNQERKTKENIEKVEKLLAKNGTASDEVDDKAQDEANKAPVANGNEHSSSEEKVAEKQEEKKDEE